MIDSRLILENNTAHRKLKRMAIEVAERNAGIPALILAGIRENGYFIAQKIAGYLREFYSGKIDVVALRINKRNPMEVSFDSDPPAESCIILTDDVANTGRTMLYALQPMLKYLPASIQTLALVERTHKLFPVSIDYIGISVSTTKGENIVVTLNNDDISATLQQISKP